VVAFKVERGEAVPLLRAAPEAPRELAGLVHRAMAPRPELRFASALEMRRAVEEVMAGKRAGTAGAGAALSVPRPGGTAPPAAAEIEAPAQTLRAPPIGSALLSPAAPAYGAPMVAATPPPAGARGRARRGRGAAAILFALPVLVGAGVAGVLFATGQWGSGSRAAPAPTTQPAAQSESAPVVPQAPPTTTDTRSQVPALIPARPTPAGPRALPSARPVADAAPSASVAPPSPVGLPTSFPSVLPPFPSGIPFPAGFPTSIPGLPSAFPGWPPAAPPAPAPTRTESI
jgi:hypothetical protein